MSLPEDENPSQGTHPARKSPINYIILLFSKCFQRKSTCFTEIKTLGSVILIECKLLNRMTLQDTTEREEPKLRILMMNSSSEHRKREEKEHRTPVQHQTLLKFPAHKGRRHPPHLCQLVKALGMSLLPLHVTLLGVAAIAIHDEGDVLGHWTCLQTGRSTGEQHVSRAVPTASSALSPAALQCCLPAAGTSRVFLSSLPRPVWGLQRNSSVLTTA